MSLADSVLEIATQIEDDAKNLRGEGTPVDAYKPGILLYFLGYARQLRSAVKAAEGSSAQPVKPEPQYPPEVQHALEVSKARKEFQASKTSVNKEEIAAGKLTELVGGASDRSFIEIDPNMQVKQGIVVACQVYELKEDGKLHYHEQETERRKPQSKIIEGKA